MCVLSTLTRFNRDSHRGTCQRAFSNPTRAHWSHVLRQDHVWCNNESWGKWKQLQHTMNIIDLAPFVDSLEQRWVDNMSRPYENFITPNTHLYELDFCTVNTETEKKSIHLVKKNQNFCYKKDCLLPFEKEVKKNFWKTTMYGRTYTCHKTSGVYSLNCHTFHTDQELDHHNKVIFCLHRGCFICVD